MLISTFYCINKFFYIQSKDNSVAKKIAQSDIKLVLISESPYLNNIDKWFVPNTIWVDLWKNYWHNYILHFYWYLVDSFKLGALQNGNDSAISNFVQFSFECRRTSAFYVLFTFVADFVQKFGMIKVIFGHSVGRHYIIYKVASIAEFDWFILMV